MVRRGSEVQLVLIGPMQSFLAPAILFFVFGILAGLLRSNLEIP